MESKQRNKKSKAAVKPDAGFGTILTGAAIGSGIALLIGGVLLFLGGALCYAMDDPNAYTVPLGTALTFLISFLGGILAVRRNGGAALLSGLCAGLIPALLFLLLRLVWKEDPAYGPVWSVLLRFLSVGVAVLGAFLGRKKDRSRHSPRRHGHMHQ